jgi:hypothetical protein
MPSAAMRVSRKEKMMSPGETSLTRNCCSRQTHVALIGLRLPLSGKTFEG